MGMFEVFPYREIMGGEAVIDLRDDALAADHRALRKEASLMLAALVREGPSPASASGGVDAWVRPFG